jgi:hypothetical protein
MTPEERALLLTIGEIIGQQICTLQMTPEQTIKIRDLLRALQTKPEDEAGD